MVFYFTATGNSLYVAKEVDAQPVSIAQAIHDPNKIYQADSIGIVCPVFGHEMPELVKEFLKISRFETNYFYILLTYGNRHGGAAELAKAYVEGLGIHPDYINVILMADNFLPGFDMEEQRRLDKKVDEQIVHIKSDLAERKHFIAPVTEQDRAAHQEFLDRLKPAPGMSPTIVSAAGSAQRYALRNASTWKDKRAYGTRRAASAAWPASTPAPCWQSS